MLQTSEKLSGMKRCKRAHPVTDVTVHYAPAVLSPFEERTLCRRHAYAHVRCVCVLAARRGVRTNGILHACSPCIFTPLVSALCTLCAYARTTTLSCRAALTGTVVVVRCSMWPPSHRLAISKATCLCACALRRARLACLLYAGNWPCRALCNCHSARGACFHWSNTYSTRSDEAIVDFVSTTDQRRLSNDDSRSA